jgi:micrococcal nuclease
VRRRLLPLAGAILALAALAPAAAGLTLAASVERVVDGDTIVVRARGFETPVRLLGIDTPETHRPGTPIECFGPEAAARTQRILPRGTAVRVVTDPTQDVRDRYARLLAYVYRASRPTSVNLALVATGYARAYVYRPDRPFLHAASYLRAERRARAQKRGLWGPPCFGSRKAPAPSRPAPSGARPGCDPAYPDVCIPPPPPDLDCADIPFRNFRVLPPDPHHFDGGGDGVGCES